MPLAGLLEVVAEVVAELVGADLKRLRRRVELRGFEPLASCLPGRRSVQLSYSPGKFEIYRTVETSPVSVLGRGEPKLDAAPAGHERNW